MFALKNAGSEEWQDKIEARVQHEFSLASLIEKSMTTPPREIAKPQSNQEDGAIIEGEIVSKPDPDMNR